ncbi:MAG: xanthine dehydrogenase family protein molybdopterin-binding subunit [Chloroflexota bacterium]
MTAVEMPSFVRQDGRDKVTGSARYSADVTLTGMLHGAFRFAGVSHAIIKRIDTSKAKALPGVVAVITAADVPAHRYGGFVQDRTLFATDRVRWEGEPIAAVAATTLAIAKQAAALIEVDLEPLPAVVDLEEAIAPGAPLIHPDWASYTGDENIERSGNVGSRSTIVKGDAAAAMARAAHVIKERYVTDGSQAVPIEPRSVTAEWHGDQVTIHSSTQVPFGARAHVAENLGIPENRVRIIVPILGGGFGGKCEGHIEPQTAALARAARRPVRIVYDRRMEMVSSDHRRERMVIDLETGVAADGTLLARRARVLVENGAYCQDEPYLTQMAAMFAVGPYRIPDVESEGLLAYTNTQPTGSVRGPTAPQVCWALEQHLDVIAATVGLDPVELRRRNIIVEGDEGPAASIFEANAAKETLERAAEMIGWGKELPEDEGIGIACGWWPNFPMASGAWVKINKDGSGTIITGAQECGTGAVMALPILAGQVLGMPPEDFRILYQDTDAGPQDGGASGSQTLFNNGRAVVAAANEIKQQLLDLASEQLEVAQGDLELVESSVRVKGSPDRSITIADLAATAYDGSLLLARGSGDPPPTPAAQEAGCVGRLGAQSFAAPAFFTQAARVRIDRSTGVVQVLEIVAAHDCGTIVNPMGAEGQITGGVIMGMGQALTESVQLSPDGRQVNADLLDYKLPTAADAPAIRVAFIQKPAPNAGPNGLKGVAEPPCVPTPGAIANAIADALGTRIKELPMTPVRVWRALEASEGTAS